MNHRLRIALLALLLASCTHDEEPEPLSLRSSEDEAPAVTEIRASGVLRLAPAVPDTPYRRCGTAAGETAWRASFSADNRRMAAHTNAGTVRLIATDGWTELAEVGHAIGQVDAVAFSPDGSLLATLSLEAGEVALWKTSDATLDRAIKVRKRMTGYPLYGSGLLFAADGRHLITSLATVIDLTTDKVSEWNGATDKAPEETTGGFGVRFFSLVDGKADRLLVHNAEQITNMVSRQYLTLRELGTRNETEFVDASIGTALFAVSADSALMAYGGKYSGRKGLLLVDLRTQRLLGDDPQGVSLRPLGFSADKTELYTTVQNEIEVLAVPSMASLRRFRWSFQPTFLGISPTGLLAEASEQGTSFWDPKTGERKYALPYPLRALSWSPDGSLRAAAGGGMMLRVWRESDGKELVRITQPDSKLPTFRPAPPQPTGPDAWRNRILSQTEDGKILVREQFAIHFGSSDWYATRVEEVATKQLLREFPYTRGRRAELSPDGSRLSTVEYELGGSAPFVAVWCR